MFPYLLNLNNLKNWLTESQKILLHPWQHFQLKGIDLPEKMVYIAQSVVNTTPDTTVNQMKKNACSKIDCQLIDTRREAITNCDTNKDCLIGKDCHMMNCHYDIQSLFYLPDNYLQMRKHKNFFQKQSTAVVVALVLSERLRKEFFVFESQNDVA